MKLISGSLTVLCGILSIAIAASVAFTTHTWMLPVGIMVSGSLFVIGGMITFSVGIMEEIDKGIEENKEDNNPSS